MNQHRYTDADLAAVYRVIAERRDMRHFLPTRIESQILTNILQAAHHAPSVGLMQPWRFIRITDINTRLNIHRLVKAEQIKTAEAIGELENNTRMAEFLRLKVEGILDCGELLVVALCDKREQHIFGRRTMPEMDLASVSCAIQNMWLASRAEGLGMGWVSIFDPVKLGQLLKMPTTSKPIALLCIGHVNTFYKEPMLVESGWKEAKSLEEMVMENCWDNSK